MQWYVGTGWRSPVKIDTLRLGVWIDFNAYAVGIVEEGRRRADDERTAGPTAEEVAMVEGHGAALVRPGHVHVGGVTCEVRRGVKFYMVTFATGDWDCQITTRVQAASEQQAPGMLVTFRSAALADHGFETVERFLRWAELLGVVAQVKLSRLDLAMDVASSEPSLDWLRRDLLVTKAVTSRVRFEPEDDAPELAHALLQSFAGAPQQVEASAMDRFEVEGIRERRRLSSINVGSRGRASVYMRLYDKVLQTRKMHIAHVESEWRAHGWDETRGVRDAKGEVWGTIWRCEFELGREWLIEHGLDAFGDLVRMGIRAVWKTLTTTWLRVVQDEKGAYGRDRQGRELGVGRRENRDCVEFWKVIQSGADLQVAAKWDPFIGPRPRETAAAKRAEPAAPRVSEQLRASAAGTIATLAAGRGLDMQGYAQLVFEVALEALKRVPDKSSRMAIINQALLAPDRTTGEIRLPNDRRALHDAILRTQVNPDNDEETPF